MAHKNRKGFMCTDLELTKGSSLTDVLDYEFIRKRV